MSTTLMKWQSSYSDAINIAVVLAPSDTTDTTYILGSRRVSMPVAQKVRLSNWDKIMNKMRLIVNIVLESFSHPTKTTVISKNTGEIVSRI